MTALTESDKKVLHDIDQFGWHVVKIMEDEDEPGFCFSIGLHKTFNKDFGANCLTICEIRKSYFRTFNIQFS